MALELALESVGFRYRGGHQAVADVGFAMAPGIVGLLGPNGAGKSTLMRVLSTLAKASSGRVLWRGEDIARKPDVLRRELGYLPQDFGVYEALSAREFLAFLSAVKGLPSCHLTPCFSFQITLMPSAERPPLALVGASAARQGIRLPSLSQPASGSKKTPTTNRDHRFQ